MVINATSLAMHLFKRSDAEQQMRYHNGAKP